MILAGFIAGITPTWPQKTETPQSILLNPVTITATRSERAPEQIPNSITQIKRDTQQGYQPGATLDEFARGTPGYFSRINSISPRI